MIWNTIPNEERLFLWKSLRKELESLTLGEQLNKIAKFCGSMPIGSRTLDYYSPENWPTPWEILFHGLFCTSSISLLIYHTLTMVPEGKIVDLYLVKDQEDIYLLPVVNNQFVLNYHLGMVSMYPDIQRDFSVLKIYTQKEIKEIT
jgi:hypothetical protein